MPTIATGRTRPLTALLLAATLAACHADRTPGTIAVSVIGPPLGAAARGPLPAPQAALASATGRAVVRLDAEGQVTPDLAARWAITQDGLDYILRVDDGVSAHRLAQRLRSLTRAGAPLHRLLAPIDRIQAVTATVVELRLASAMPDLLPLLARPETGLAGLAGPLRIARRGEATTLVAPPADGPRGPAIQLRGERAGVAVARFAANRADLVLGGSFDDLAVARAAALPASELRFDPAIGLFGFVPRLTGTPLDDPAVREALALAIDRDRIAALLGGPATTKASTIAGSTIEPPLAQRRLRARALLGGRSVALRLALPPGPGAGLLFRLIAQDWARIGVAVTRVAADAPAELALLDSVAPAAELARVACAAAAGCDPRDARALLAPPFLPIMAPVRWSLVRRRIDRFAENALAAHPLEQLVTPR